MLRKAVVLVPLLTACGEQDTATITGQHTLSLPPLEFVAAYGSTDSVVGGEALEQEWRRVGGSMLAWASAVVEGQDSLVYVLDWEFMKIAVFRRDGSLHRIILGGEGRGPGEFIRPRSLALTAAGELLVLDEGQGRITRFDRSGNVLATIAVPLGRAIQIMAFGDRVFLRRRYFAGEFAVVEIDEAGMPRDSLVWVTVREAAIADMGEGGVLGLDGEDLLYAFPSPGEWMDVHDTAQARAGAELFPNQEGVTYDITGSTVTVLPAAVRGVGRLSDGRLAVYYVVQEFNETRTAATGLRYFLALYDAKGDYLGSTAVPGTMGVAFAVSPYAPEILVWKPDPAPQIVRYRVPDP